MFKTNLKIKFTFIVIIILMPLLCFSHPHIFIDYKADFVFENGALTNINILWFFDQYFSVSVIKNFDSNYNGIIDKNELEVFTKTTYESLGDYNYFIKLLLNKQNINIKKINNFKVIIESKDLIIYQFSIPCDIKADDEIKTVTLYFEDPTYFVALSTSQKNVILKNDNSVEIIDAYVKDKYEHTIKLKKGN